MLMFDVVSFKKFYNAVPVVNLVTPFPCLRADGESDELRRLTLLLCRLFASLLRRVEDDVRSRGSNSRRQQLVGAKDVQDGESTSPARRRPKRPGR